MSQDRSQSSSREQRLEAVLAECLREIEAGRLVDLSALQERHPDLALELSSFFTNRAALERIAKPLKASAIEPTVGMVSSDPRSDTNRVTYFGDYELLEELGRGGMGVVYKARQTTLNRLVALKMILSGELASAADVQRFRQEAEAAANLDHPHIAPIYETGEHNGQQYFSMKLIEGRSLREAWDEGCRSRETSDPTLTSSATGIRLVAQVARAVHHAHQRGVLHRDLKPGNILLDQEGTPYVTDFGLAKRVEGGSDVTRTGAIVGTPSYMAPEQARAEKVLTTAVDVYSLGAMLYELLTGQPPFREDSPVKTLLKSLSSEPARPTAINPATDRDLETIALKCLEKDPAKRYDSAAALAEELERWLRGEPILARPAGRAERTWRWCRRNPVVATLLAAVAASLALGTVVATCFAVQAARNADQARVNEKQAVANAERAREHEQLARTEQRAAEQARSRSEWLAYSGQLALAQREWQDGDVGHARELLDTCQWDLRGWEHDYLHTLFNSNQRTFRGHTSAVLCVAISADGQRIACSGGNPFSQAPGDYRLRVWDVKTGQEVLVLTGHSSDVDSLAFSPDGSRLVSGGYEVKVWDLGIGKELRTLADAISPVVFSPDGKRLLTYGPNKTMKIWDAETWVAATIPDGTTRGIGRSLAWSPDGARIVGTNGQSLKVWDVKTGKSVLDLSLSDKHQPTVAFSPGEQLIAGVGFDHAISLWDAKTGQRLRRLQGHRDYVASLAFSPDSKRLCSGSHDRLLIVWDVATGRAIRTFKGHAGGLSSVAFHRNGTQVASGSYDQTVKLWDIEVEQGPLTIKRDTGVRSLAIGPDGQIAVSSWYANAVKILDLQNGRELRTLNGGSHPVAFRRDGQRIVTDGEKNSLRIWDAVSGDLILALKEQPDTLLCAAFSPDGQQIASGSRDGSITLWDARTGEENRRLIGHGSSVVCLAFRPDGTEIASGSFDDTIRVWDVQTGRERLTLGSRVGGSSSVQSLTYSPDGRRIISGSADHAIRISDAESGRELRTLAGHTSSVDAVAISPDGRRIASGGFDKTVRVWDAESGHSLLILKDHREAVKALAFTPDGRRLVSGADSLKIWDAGSTQPSRSIRAYSTGVSQLVFSPDGRRLATGGGYDRTTKLWDTRTGQERWSLSGGGVPVSFSPDGGRIITGTDKSLKLWDLTAGRELWSRDGIIGPALFHADGRITSSSSDSKLLQVLRAEDGERLETSPWPLGVDFVLEISRDGQRVIGGNGQRMKLWDAKTGREIRSFPGQTFVAFGSDSRRLVTGHTAITVWDATTGEELRTLGPNGATITCSAFSPENRWIAVGRERAVQLLDFETGQVVRTIHEFDGAVSCLAFSPDCRVLAIGSWDGLLKFWKIEPYNPKNATLRKLREEK